MKVIPIKSAKPRGRPRKEINSNPSDKMRTKLWYRHIKEHVLDDPKLDNPEHHKVANALSEITHEEYNFSATQCWSWHYGNSLPSKKTLSRFEKISLSYHHIFSSDPEDTSGTLIPFAKSKILFFSAIDLFESARRQERNIIGRAMEILFQIDLDWRPCHGIIGFYSEQAADISKQSKWNKSKHKINNCHHWDKPDLYPGLEVNSECLTFYNHYNPSSLILWLLSISPVYLIHERELERLSIDTFTTALCLMVLRMHMPTSSRTKASVLTSRQFTALLHLHLDPEDSLTHIEDILSDEITWPYENLSPTGSVMKKTLMAMQKSNHDWLQRNGITIDEVSEALDGY